MVGADANRLGRENEFRASLSRRVMKPLGAFWFVVPQRAAKALAHHQDKSRASRRRQERFIYFFFLLCSPLLCCAPHLINARRFLFLSPLWSCGRRFFWNFCFSFLCTRSLWLAGWLARPSRDDIKCQMKISPPSQIAFFLCFLQTTPPPPPLLCTERKEREERRGGRILCQSDSNGKCYKPAHFLNLMSRALCARAASVCLSEGGMRDATRCVRDEARGLSQIYSLSQGRTGNEDVDTFRQCWNNQQFSKVASEGFSPH
jgi:hypothetical protein